MSEWKAVVLGKIGSFNNGINKENSYFGHGVPFVNLLDVFDKSSIADFPKDLVDATENEIHRFSLKKGDILFVRSSVKPEGVGKTCVILSELPATVYSGFIIRYRQDNCVIDAAFAKYCFYSTSFRRQLLSFSSVSANTNINQVSLKKMCITIPTSLPEQRKIARILSTVDAVIEKTEAAIAKYEAIKKGMMADLFTRGIDPATGKLRPHYEDAPELYKETELGWVPKEWEVPRIGDIAVHVGSGVTPTGGSEVYKNEGILFIRSQNVHFEGLYLNDVAFLSPETHENMQRSTVLPNDVLLNITGASIGRCCYFPAKLFEANVNQHVCIIRVEKSCESKAIYLSQVLSSYIGQVQISKLNAGGNREGLNYKQLRAFFVPWPRENSEIERMANMLRSINDMIEKEKVTLHKSHLIKQGLMAGLLTGRVRVQLSGEPAAEMTEVSNG